MKSPESGCESFHEWSRRALLKGAATGAAAMLFGPSALAQIALKREQTDRDALVVVFLRGGADGLNVVTPYAEEEYFRFRPSLALAAPKKGIASNRVIDLDGFFGFHPSFAPIESLYKEGKLGVIHAIGSGDGSGSHFEAMSAMERGLNRGGAEALRTSGWLARYLNATQTHTDSPLRALALTDVIPDSLMGAIGAQSFSKLNAFQLHGSEEFKSHIEKVYAKGDDPMTVSGRETMRLLKSLERLDYKGYEAKGGVTYPDTNLGNGLRQVAFLQKAEVGLEVAFLDHGGYDTHVVQGAGTGWLANLLSDLAKSVRAFSDDMGPRMNRTTVIVMTEFGRRVYENGGLGTDHGRASFMLTMGGGVRGGKVYGKWPGLKKENLEGPGDLRVTTDYRCVLAEVLTKKLGRSNIEEVFPGFDRSDLGIIRDSQS